eukprot:CAMPEP_0194782380 /NCGR_PEP_ID=MMETSP0323_2-20130528/78658_1 /TAXON_ID=2866 ORGANISM="Crypthecodinium cohnii, Strain Seligo" /NCGR_SAMPLE_ID=MMETSP0323_2 /ASSEMBLY_ACC=CAM_ASM_000346 /LENGTH=218 /DNA_ID=CAMNT_0039721189 /DNA_START=652 /DNA_END=1308 /DNA_ORIENTATION=+
MDKKYSLLWRLFCPSCCLLACLQAVQKRLARARVAGGLHALRQLVLLELALRRRCGSRGCCSSSWGSLMSVHHLGLARPHHSIDCMHCVNWSCWNWHFTGAAAAGAAAAAAGAPSCRCTTSVWRGPITASTARFAMLMPTPVAMPEAMEPISPDSMPPPPPTAGAGAGAAAAGAGAGGGGVAAGGGACAAGAAERWGAAEEEVRAPLRRGMMLCWMFG